MINPYSNTELAIIEFQEFGEEFVSVSNLSYAYLEFCEITSGINLSVAADQADIVFIFTREMYKRQGYAEKLIIETIKELEKQGIKKLFLEVDTENVPAIKLYEKLNFKEINRRKEYYANGHDAIVMEREI